MNLLELMLKEEIEWPVGAGFAAQDQIYNGVSNNLCFYYSKPSRAHSHMWSAKEGANVLAPSSSLKLLSDDWLTRIITREEYQAAGGWMKWEGGKSHPVSWCDIVRARWNDGDITTGEMMPIDFHIDSDGTPNIVAYRIIGQLPVQLDNPEESDFDPIISVEDARECKAENAATAKQSAPKGSGNPILGMVLADLTNRALEGKEKYGEPLKVHNGRNALWDAYQEALDLAMYLRQAIGEQDK